MVDHGKGRRAAVITGACGGMGLACARLLGRRHDLILTDVAAERLAAAASQLSDEGYAVAHTVAGDLGGEEVLKGLSEALAEPGRLGPLIHTAGLAPSIGDWEAIMKTNLVATARLLATIEPLLTTGSVGVLIASMAGHQKISSPELDAILDQPLAPDFMARVEPHMHRLAEALPHKSPTGPSYFLSKRAVIRMCEQRAPDWARRGARIVSISPGVIYTPMGRKEFESGIATRTALEATPIKRWGTALDIAAAADFLASDLASYITGCDLRVDGGSTPARFGSTF